jgi:hypothetical protein
VFHIRELVISERQEDHIWMEHQVRADDVYEVCEAARLVIRGRNGGFAIFGQTNAGRYLVLFVHPRGNDVYALATARDMTQTERRRIRDRTPMDLYDDNEE